MPRTTAYIGPRERLTMVGLEGLSDEELVALILGTGAPGESVHVLAARMVTEGDGLLGIERAGLRRLARVPGVGVGKAARLLAAIELGRRINTRPLRRGEPLQSSREVDAALRPRLARAEIEHFFAIPLDAKNRPMGELRVATGGRTHCPVAPGDVFRGLLREAATSVVFVHNHPSGEPSPSAEDVALTQRLHQAGELLGVRVVDHVIIAGDGYFSFLDAGLLASPSSDAGDGSGSGGGPALVGSARVEAQLDTPGGPCLADRPPKPPGGIP